MEPHATVDRASPGLPRAHVVPFWGFTPLGRTVRIVVLSLISVFVVIEIAAAVAGAGDDALSTTVAQVALTASFALFAWHPPAAALALQVGAGTSAALGAGDASLVAVAVAAGLVVATCSRGLSAAYLVGFGGWIVLFEVVVPQDRPVGTTVALVLIVTISTIVGVGVRRLRGREAQLAEELAERERMLETAVRVERERIADELHDFIAHDLTIIAMHARVLEQSDDPEVHRESRAAIDGSARQALADVRRVLQLTHASRPTNGEPEPASDRRLVPTLTDVERELSAAGTEVETDGVYSIAPLLSRSMDLALARFLRESATNIVKHAASTGSVSITFTSEEDDVVMRIANTTGGSGASLTLPPGGYGLARMRERASVLGGTFMAGPADGGWLVEVHLPAR